MRMTVTAFDDANYFLNKQEHQYAGQNPQTYSDFVIMIVGIFWRRRFGATILAVVVLVMMMMMMFVWGQRVRDQMQERVTQQSARRETQEYLQKRLVFVIVVDGYEEQYEKRQHADGHGGRQRPDPQHRVGDHESRLGGTVVVMMIVVMTVPVARTEFWQRQQNEREQQWPVNVFQETFYVHRVAADRLFLSI